MRKIGGGEKFATTVYVVMSVSLMKGARGCLCKMDLNCETGVA